MSSGELLLTIVVALIVFGPSKLPTLATHLGQIIKRLNQLRTQASSLWHQQLQELQLQESHRKALEADAKYKSKTNSE